MSGATEPSDPFAGYTPVKVAPIDGPKSQLPAAEKKPRAYRFGRKREGGVSRTVKFFGLVLVSLVLLVLIAILSYGFIYERPLDVSLAKDEPATNGVWRLSELGCEARMRVRAAMAPAEGESPAKKSSDTTNQSFVERTFPVLQQFLNRNDRMKKSARSLADGEVPESAETEPTNVTVSVRKRVVNPALKRFKGGRMGRTIDGGGQR